MPQPGQHNAWHDEFLEALRRVPVVQYACDAVHIQRCTAYRAREAHPDFAQAWDDAMEAGIDRAEQEAHRRAVIGFEEPVIFKGQLCYRKDENGNLVPLTVRKHSDLLLTKILAARRQAYRTERTEHVSPDGSMSPTDEATRSARVAQLMAAARARKAAEDAGDFSDLA